jgi:hypothetical protein
MMRTARLIQQTKQRKKNMKNKIKIALAVLALGASALVASAQDNSTPPGDGPNAPRPNGHRPPPPAIIAALDANHDGVIDADEIANAPAALRSLDKNGDGKLTPDEFMGKRPQPERPDGNNGDMPPNDAPSGPPPAQN